MGAETIWFVEALVLGVGLSWCRATVLYDGIVQVDCRDAVLGHDSSSLVVEVDDAAVVFRSTHVCRAKREQKLRLRLLLLKLQRDIFQL